MQGYFTSKPQNLHLTPDKKSRDKFNNQLRGYLCVTFNWQWQASCCFRNYSHSPWQWGSFLILRGGCFKSKSFFKGKYKAKIIDGSGGCRSGLQAKTKTFHKRGIVWIFPGTKHFTCLWTCVQMQATLSQSKPLNKNKQITAALDLWNGTTWIFLDKHETILGKFQENWQFISDSRIS